MNSPSSPSREGRGVVHRCNARIKVKKYKGKKRVKYTLEQATRTQRGSRAIALLALLFL
jgi:hypothetical protein